MEKLKTDQCLTYDDLHKVIGYPANVVLLQNHLSMSKLKGDMKFDSPVGLSWLTSNQDSSKMMSRGEFITTLVAQRFEDANEIYVGSDAAEVEKILEVLDNYKIGRHGKEGSIVVTEHVSPKRGLAGHELGCLVMVNSIACPTCSWQSTGRTCTKGTATPISSFWLETNWPTTLQSLQGL
jgi:hypothetical protein